MIIQISNKWLDPDPAENEVPEDEPLDELAEPLEELDLDVLDVVPELHFLEVVEVFLMVLVSTSGSLEIGSTSSRVLGTFFLTTWNSASLSMGFTSS